jgi:hypothetical protein
VAVIGGFCADSTILIVASRNAAASHEAKTHSQEEPVMRKKLLFLALVLATTLAATSRPGSATVTCGPFQHRLVCGDDVYCCPAILWPSCPCP